MNTHTILLSILCIAGMSGIYFTATGGKDGVLPPSPSDNGSTEKDLLAKIKSTCESGEWECKDALDGQKTICDVYNNDATSLDSEDLNCETGNPVSLRMFLTDPEAASTACFGESRRQLFSRRIGLVEEKSERKLSVKGRTHGESWPCPCSTSGLNVFNGQYKGVSSKNLHGGNEDKWMKPISKNGKGQSWAGAEQFRHCKDEEDCLEFQFYKSWGWNSKEYACNGKWPCRDCPKWKKVRANLFIAVYSPGPAMHECVCTAFKSAAVKDSDDGDSGAMGVKPECAKNTHCPSIGSTYETFAVGECGVNGGPGKKKHAGLVIHDICQAYIGSTKDIASNLLDRAKNFFSGSWFTKFEKRVQNFRDGGNNCDDEAMQILTGDLPYGIGQALFDGQCDQ